MPFRHAHGDTCCDIVLDKFAVPTSPEAGQQCHRLNHDRGRLDNVGRPADDLDTARGNLRHSPQRWSGAGRLNSDLPWQGFPERGCGLLPDWIHVTRAHDHFRGESNMQHSARSGGSNSGGLDVWRRVYCWLLQGVFVVT